MKVGDHRLVPSERLVPVPMRERHHSLSARSWRVTAEIEVHGHALPSARRGVVQGKNPLNPDGVIAFVAFTLPDADGVGPLVIFAVPDVPQVHLKLTCNEELVGRRKEPD